MYYDIFISGKPHKEWKKADVIAILQPGKSEDNLKKYRPISLLSVMYKLIERKILKHLEPLIENVILAFQAGFRPNRGCCDQILAITSYLEKGYNDNVKMSAAFIGPSAALNSISQV